MIKRSVNQLDSEKSSIKIHKNQTVLQEFIQVDNNKQIKELRSKSKVIQKNISEKLLSKNDTANLKVKGRVGYANTLKSKSAYKFGGISFNDPSYSRIQQKTKLQLNDCSLVALDKLTHQSITRDVFAKKIIAHVYASNQQDIYKYISNWLNRCNGKIEIFKFYLTKSWQDLHKIYNKNKQFYQHFNEIVNFNRPVAQ